MKAAPPVVRSYDACESGHASRLRHARNETSAARQLLVASPLPILAIVFFGTHTERMPLVHSAYAPYFASLVFMTLNAHQERGGRARGGTRRVTHHHCRAGLKATYACVAEVARTHGARPAARELGESLNHSAIA